MKESFNPEEYRNNLAKELKEIRKENSEKAQEYLKEARETQEYQEAERIYRSSTKVAKLESDFETGMQPSSEGVPVDLLIEKYNIGEITEKFDRSKIEELLSKTESREEKFNILLEQVSHTPLLELKNILPNNNNLYVKLESETACWKVPQSSDTHSKLTINHLE